MEGYFYEGTGKLKIWYPSGKICIEKELKNGKPYGKEIGWYENGQKEEEQTYNEEGKRIGKFTHWYEDGKVACEMEFDPNGRRLYKRDYDRKGNLIFDNDRPVGKKKMINSFVEIPPIFDLRNENKVTAVKDQLQTDWSNTCWAFAYTGALESRLMPPVVPLVEPDFSEQHLADKNHGWDPNGLSQGGRLQMALAYLTRGGGPIAETDMPYDPEHAFGRQISFPAKKWIREVQRSNNNASWYNGYDGFCQEHIFTQNHGGVAGSLYFDQNQFNSNGNNYYWYSLVATPPSNHTVVLVGWNNSYRKENFRQFNGHLPYMDGALIVKNSWGTNWGESGYFYISMDSLRFDPNTAFIDVAEPTYNYTYQYDTLGLVTNIGFATPPNQPSECTCANVFEAEHPLGTIDNLRAVGLFLPWDQLGQGSFNYTISVYTNLTDANNPQSGTHAAGPITGQGGTLPGGWYRYGGYYTQDLPNPVPIKGGSKFSVVVKNSRDPFFQTCGYSVEKRSFTAVTPDNPHPLSTSNASSKSGESFELSTTGWKDLKVVYPNETLNACIKAFTDGNFDHYWKLKEALDAPTLNVTSDNGYNLNWVRAIDGEQNDSAQSSWINKGERCHMDATVEGPIVISFYWKVSADAGNNLKFYVDGIETSSIGGITDWEQQQINILAPGAHKLEWSYEKTVDATAAVADCGWVDRFGQSSGFTVVSPNGGEGWPSGSSQLITWVCGAISGNLRIELLKDDVLIGLIAEVPAVPGRYLWDVGSWTGGRVPPGTGYKIRIRTPDGSLLKVRLQKPE